ncbi:putative transcriptional regulator, AraC family protein [Streptomyces sp. Tu6071]|uniref:Helix-turn-helix domain-containing protein n=2 Tax=Streptomyces TaxID=1883 RepID=A0ABD5E9A5_9ACTN|nr:MULTISPECIES: helix-turn-helix domain-containing protein [unclassified Streptomyces]ASY33413.1 hypothetical protein CAC01_12535 [Streptomyces sp. CLI2509]EGJ75483.1 putative transcriptional regulator, AraC family protein [Streptomyces sp. Tu6071]MDT0418000.1 helix-turn-helix domain-containing protein [Streptomyces sp. DSM 41982]
MEFGESPGIGRQFASAAGDDAVIAFLQRMYGMGVAVEDLGRSAQVSVSRLETASVAVDRVASTTRFGFEAGPIDTLMVLYLRSGTFEARTGGVAAAVRAWQPMVAFQPGLPAVGYLDRMDTRTVTVDLATVRSVAGFGAHEEREPLHFTSLTPASEALGESWRATADYAAQVLGTGVGEPLVHDTLARALAGVALAAFPNTYRPQDPEARTPGRVGVATVLRAAAAAEAGAAAPLGLAELAEAEGVPGADLAAGFARHLGLGPAALVRRFRLARAHAEAREGAPGTDLTALAHRWGWADPRAFVHAYRTVYGGPPLPGTA